LGIRRLPDDEPGGQIDDHESRPGRLFPRHETAEEPTFARSGEPLHRGVLFLDRLRFGGEGADDRVGKPTLDSPLDRTPRIADDQPILVHRSASEVTSHLAWSVGGHVAPDRPALRIAPTERPSMAYFCARASPGPKR